MLVALIAIGASASPVFLTARNFANLIAAVIEVAIMALPMALIIIAGEIDLSVEAMAGLSVPILGFLFDAGVPIEVAIPIVLVVGALGGLLNGILVTRFGLPSLVVTLGTLALYPRTRPRRARVTGRQRVPGLVHELRVRDRPGTPIPWPFLIFVGPRASCSASCCIARGSAATSMPSARTLRPPATRACAWPGSSSGSSCCRARSPQPAGVILTARFASARADVGEGLTLIVVTIVLLGGVDIFGGRGTIPGVVLAFFTLAVLGNVLRLANVSSDIQSIAVGVLLIVSVVIPTLARRVKSAVDSARGGRRTPAGAVPGETASP